MKRITDIEIHPPFEIICTFCDGSVRNADLHEIMQSPVFEPLKNPLHFLKGVNRGYYVEWPEWELDLSADTIWHVGKPVLEGSFKTVSTQ